MYIPRATGIFIFGKWLTFDATLTATHGPQHLQIVRTKGFPGFGSVIAIPARNDFIMAALLHEFNRLFITGNVLWPRDIALMKNTWVTGFPVNTIEFMTQRYACRDRDYSSKKHLGFGLKTTLLNRKRTFI